MVKLVVVARCIPEDVYLNSLEHPTTALAGEKKFSIVIREPESWYIGRLAVEIKTRYENLYRRPFGQVKYLKDSDDDCDLDPEALVIDLLVDEGKAIKDGTDQKKVVKVIQEGGRAIRDGSVMPDLTLLHFQPPTRPPIPIFPSAEKHNQEEPDQDTRPSKRRRLDQIEESEGEDIMHSIECSASFKPSDHALNSGDIAYAATDIKLESPGARVWANTMPATRDELEYLPDQPENWRQHEKRHGLSKSLSGRGVPTNTRSKDRSGEPERIGPRQEPLRTTPSLRPSIQNPGKSPGTPARISHGDQNSANNAVTMLNGMKPPSPAVQQRSSNSASKFRNAKGNIFDVPESDIEDSQMSPSSRAARKPITPRLVKTPQVPNGVSSTTRRKHSPLLSTRLGGHASKVKSQKPAAEDSAETSNIHSVEGAPSETGNDKMSDEISWKRNGFSNIALSARSISQAREQSSASIKTAKYDDSGARAPRTIQDDIAQDASNTDIRSSREKSKSSGTASSSRSSSAASSSRSTHRSAFSDARSSKNPRQKSSTGNDDEDETMLDSPSAQLEETLRKSSPMPRKSTELRARGSLSKFDAQSKVDTAALAATPAASEVEENIDRPPDSDSDEEQVVTRLKALKHPETKSPRNTSAARPDANPKSSEVEILKCYTCWVKGAKCDNARPKCSRCQSGRKNCQIYGMSKQSADSEKATRLTVKQKSESKKSVSRTRPMLKQKVPVVSKPPKLNLSKEGVSGSDQSDESDETTDDEAISEAVSRHKDQISGQKSVPNVKVRVSSAPGKSTENPLRLKKKTAEATSIPPSRRRHRNDFALSDESLETDGVGGDFQNNQKISRKQMDSDEGDEPFIVNTSTTGADDVSSNRAIKAKMDRDFDFDNHCGVTIPTGGLCERNIACKKHNMPEKLEVKGRTLPLRELLQVHKQRRTALETIKPNAMSASVPAQTLPKTLVAAERHTTIDEHEHTGIRDESVGSGVAPSANVLPPGMTEEQYERQVKERVHMTETQRKEKLDRAREQKTDRIPSTPLVPQTQSSQNVNGRSKKAALSSQSDGRVTSSSQTSTKQKKSMPSTDPKSNSFTFAEATTPAPVTSLVPRSAPPKANEARPSVKTNAVKARLQLHPAVATTAASLDSDQHANPPFRQPQRKPLPKSAAVVGGQINTAPKRLNELRAQLKVKNASKTSTPQPQTLAEKLGLTSRNSQQRKGFEVEDDDDEDEQETETDTESEEEPKAHPKKASTVTAVNDLGLSSAIIRRRQSTPSSSDSSDDSGSDDW